MTLKKVTREEALAELEELFEEVESWDEYLSHLSYYYNYAEDSGASKDLLDELHKGIKEGNDELNEVREAYEAQYKYCHKRGWV